MTNTEAFLERLRSHATSQAIAEPSHTWHYSQLLAAIDDIAEHVRTQGLEPGDVVAIHADHSGWGIAALLGAWSAGLIAVPVNPLVPLDAQTRMLNISGACAKLTVEPTAVTTIDGVPGNVPVAYQRLRESDAPGLVLFTSGSSGEPKGVVHDVDRLLTRFADRREGRRVAAFLLFDHIGGINTVLHTLAHGGCVVTMPDRNPLVVAERVSSEFVQVLPTTPTYLNMLAIAGVLPQLSNLELITYGTEVMPTSTLAAVRRALPNVRLLQTYGMSELGIVRSRSIDDSTWVSIGGPELQWRIEDGTLRIRTSTAMTGYLNAADPFDADGWFDTGDEVEVDEVSGQRIRFLGRRDDALNIGGQKVHPATVETVIADVPGVLDVAVFSEPSPLTGRAVGAFVFTTLPQRQMRAAIRTACLARLEPWQVPTRIRFTDSPMATDRFKRDRHLPPPK